MRQGFALQAWTLPAAKFGSAERRVCPVCRAPRRAAQQNRRALSVAAEDTEIPEVLDAEPIFEDADTPSSGLSTEQVQSVLSMLCEETDIMQIELKMDDFELYAQRSIKGVESRASDAAPPAAAVAPPLETPFTPPLSPMDNMGQATAPPPNPTQSVMTVDDEPVDESVIQIPSPKVGVFRRGRYAKGKRIGKGYVVEPGNEVKKGQTLAYVEQLGTFIPVESPQAGQIATFLVDDGEAVEYTQKVVELAPFFGGHIIGESKWN